MRKGIIIGLILIAGLILVSAVYAHFPGGGYGIGKLRWGDVDIEAVKKFQRDTLPLRDELIVKKLELWNEYDKENPDRDHIASLKKEIIDIRTKIQKKADEAGLPVNKGGRMGHGMMGKGMMERGCQYPMGR